MTRLSHTKERLGAAVHGLAAGHGPIKERLEAALLVCASLRPADFPEGELRHKWSRIQTIMTGGETGSEARLKAALGEIDLHEASRIAGMLVELALQTYEFHRP